MAAPENYVFSKTHEWVKVMNDIAYVGISDHAQDELGDIVFVELPEPGVEVAAGDEVTTIESVKAAGQIYAPVSGTIDSVNTDLDEKPEIINEAPYEAHIYTIRITNPEEVSGLLSEEAYLSTIEE